MLQLLCAEGMEMAVLSTRGNIHRCNVLSPQQHFFSAARGQFVLLVFALFFLYLIPVSPVPPLLLSLSAAAKSALFQRYFSSKKSH